MFTVIFTFIGLIVFLISILYTTFKVSFWRLVGFVATGVVLDVLMFVTIGTFVYFIA